MSHVKHRITSKCRQLINQVISSVSQQTSNLWYKVVSYWYRPPSHHHSLLLGMGWPKVDESTPSYMRGWFIYMFMCGPWRPIHQQSILPDWLAWSEVGPLWKFRCFLWAEDGRSIQNLLERWDRDPGHSPVLPNNFAGSLSPKSQTFKQARSFSQWSLSTSSGKEKHRPKYHSGYVGFPTVSPRWCVTLRCVIRMCFFPESWAKCNPNVTAGEPNWNVIRAWWFWLAGMQRAPKRMEDPWRYMLPSVRCGKGQGSCCHFHG